jgi:hypothetical protein
MRRCFALAKCWPIWVALLPGPTLAKECAAPPGSTSPPVAVVTESSPDAHASDHSSGAPPVLSSTADLSEQPLFRFDNYPAAWTAAQQSNRPILVYVSMPNCPFCVKMLEQTYGKSAVEEMVKGSFETVCVDRSTNRDLVESLRVRWYPTTVLVSPNNKVLDKIEGFLDAKNFRMRLQTGLASLEKTTATR